MQKINNSLHLMSGIVLTGVLALAPFAISGVQAQTVSTTGNLTLNQIIPLCEITRGLTVGSVGEDVRCLQRYLNRSGFTLAVSGPGSSGSETDYFGPLTEQAVVRWQNVYSSTVLQPLGLASGTGYWGSSSQGTYVTLVRSALAIVTSSSSTLSVATSTTYSGS